MADELGPWNPMSPNEAGDLFRDVGSPWWIAGGYAIELFVGRPLRSHGDVDILLLRRDQGVAHEVLPGWDVQAADPPGSLRPWPVGEWLGVEIHDIWCREHRDGPWRLQFMLDESDGEEWVSRRDDRIRRPIETLTVRTADGLPILAPEIQLFYKSRGLRPKDESDFRDVLPLLSPDSRTWLDDALALVSPDHPWRPNLRAEP